MIISLPRAAHPCGAFFYYIERNFLCNKKEFTKKYTRGGAPLHELSFTLNFFGKQHFPIKNRKGNRRTRFPKFTTSVSLRWHYPHQVYGSKFATSSQPVYKLPCFLIDVTIKLFFKIVNRFFRVTKLKIEFLCFFEILPKRH